MLAANSHSLDLHAEQLQQRREDAHVVQQEDVAAGPAEDVGLGVALVKHAWGDIFLSLTFLIYQRTQRDKYVPLRMVKWTLARLATPTLGQVEDGPGHLQPLVAVGHLQGVQQPHHVGSVLLRRQLDPPPASRCSAL